MAKAKLKIPRATAPNETAPDTAFLAGIGREVRSHRAKRGMTRRQLAQASETSERYLAQIEGGGGNPSAGVLRAIAHALDVPVVALLPEAGARTPALGAVIELIARLPESELADLATHVAAQLALPAHTDRDRRIALVGLRGAGKSTLGRMLALHLGWPLIELDRVVAEEYGASIPDLIEMAGTATFRRHERSALDRIVETQQAAVITTAGGIVSNAETYALLLRRCHTLWIKARPEDHMSRVMAQGDFRPMARNHAAASSKGVKAKEAKAKGANAKGAMADLLAILQARRADYARAEAELDTSGDTADQSFAKLLLIVTPWIAAERK